MTHFNSLSVRLSNSQLNKLRLAARNEVTLKHSILRF